MSISRITVNSRQSLDFTVTSYLAKGFVIANYTSNRVALQKQK